MNALAELALDIRDWVALLLVRVTPLVYGLHEGAGFWTIRLAIRVMSPDARELSRRQVERINRLEALTKP